MFGALIKLGGKNAAQESRLLKVRHRAADAEQSLPESSYLVIKPREGIWGSIKRLGPLAQGVLMLSALALSAYLLTVFFTTLPSAETFFERSMRGGVWSGLGSFFIFKMITDPQPFEMLTICLATPLVWRSMPTGWRLLFYPIAGQMLYIFISRMALIPTEFALFRILRETIAALGAI